MEIKRRESRSEEVRKMQMLKCKGWLPGPLRLVQGRISLTKQGLQSIVEIPLQGVDRLRPKKKVNQPRDTTSSFKGKEDVKAIA